MIRKQNIRQGLRQLGPGLITGAADDDPSGIATYSQAGAQFGFSMLWTVVVTLPLMAAIQIISARIGYVTRQGLAANIKASFPRKLWGQIYASFGVRSRHNCFRLKTILTTRKVKTFISRAGSPPLAPERSQR